MDSIGTITLNNVDIQENGIIRNSKGYLIGRLVDGVDFNGEHVKKLGIGYNEKMNLFAHELMGIINSNSIENLSDTPDYILTDYLINCLEAYNSAIIKNKKHQN